MKYGFVGQLYRLMRAGDTQSFRRMIRSHPASALNRPADGCVAPVLISAVFARRADYLEELLEAGADPNLKDTSTKGAAHNLCPLHAALLCQDAEMVAALRRRGAAEDFGTAVFAQNVPAVKRALEADPALISSAYIRSTFTLLHVAAELGSKPLTQLFLDRGLGPDQADGDGHTPLYFAARNTPAIGVMDELVKAGADVNAPSRTGLTALCAACRSNESLRSVLWLLDRGANPNLLPKDRNGPLLRAARLKNMKMVQALLQHGADPDAADKKGETARDIARKKRAGAILDLLTGRADRE